jgi:putative thioredoxin
MAQSPFIIDVTAENFMAVVIEGSQQVPVLVDFWAPWCQPCQTLIPLLEKLANEYQGAFILAKLNTEEQQALAMQFQIRSIPAVKLFYQGQLIDEFMGVLPEPDIRTFLARVVQPQSAGPMDDIRTALQQANTDAAGIMLADFLAADPDNVEARILQAQLHTQVHEYAQAQAIIDLLPAEAHFTPEVQVLKAQLLFSTLAQQAAPIATLQEQLTTNPNDSQARYMLAAQLVMQEQFEAALNELLTLVRKDRGYADDAARKAMLELFALLGDSPLVTSYRAKLSSALY